MYLIITDCLLRVNFAVMKSIYMSKSNLSKSFYIVANIVSLRLKPIPRIVFEKRKRFLSFSFFAEQMMEELKTYLRVFKR